MVPKNFPQSLPVDTRQGLATELLKDDTKREQLKLKMNNRYDALRLLMQQETNTGLTLVDLWDSMKRVWKESAELVLGNKRHHNQPWISQQTLDKLDERRKAKANVNQAQTRQQKKQAQQT